LALLLVAENSNFRATGGGGGGRAAAAVALGGTLDLATGGLPVLVLVLVAAAVGGLGTVGNKSECRTRPMLSCVGIAGGAAAAGAAAALVLLRGGGPVEAVPVEAVEALFASRSEVEVTSGRLLERLCRCCCNRRNSARRRAMASSAATEDADVDADTDADADADAVDLDAEGVLPPRCFFTG
jgi:hypothetical protein